MKKNIVCLFLLVFLLVFRGALAQSNEYLIEENCASDESGAVCNRTYSTNALDLNHNKKLNPVSELGEVSVDEHIRQIEEANIQSNRPLPYANKDEKEEYIKAAHYIKLKKKFESTSSRPDDTIRISVAFKTPFSPNIYDMEKHPLYGMPQDEAKNIVENAAQNILTSLNYHEYDDLWPLGPDNIMSIRVTNTGLEKLYLNPNVLDIFQLTRMKTMNN